MNKTLKKRVLLSVLVIALSPVIYVGGSIGVAAITEYQPKDVEPSVIVNQINNTSPLKTSLSIMTYNIGYGGMGSKQDFFMDGGTMSRAIDQEYVRASMKGIIQTVKDAQVDVVFLQEADLKAARSYNINEVNLIKDAFPLYEATFAKNYDVKWVPVPWTNPMGGVQAGLMTLSSVQNTGTNRYQLPGYESIPTRYADLKRCVMVNTYPVENGKTAILINVHLSAFDKGGFIRSQQMTWLLDFIKRTYDPTKNYIILGGDWNQLLSQALYDAIEGPIPEWIAVVPETLNESGFITIYDQDHTTVRSAEKPYEEGITFETTIDGFLVSPNVALKSVETVETHFKDSDHKPVIAQFIFK